VSTLCPLAELQGNGAKEGVTALKHSSLPKTRNEFLLEALYAGIFSGSAVALLFLLLDTLDGRPLFTPSLLGSVLFLGIDAQDVTVRFDAIVYFSVMHMAVFTALGAAISFVVHEIELHSRHPSLLLVLIFVFIEAAFFVVAPLMLPGVIEQLGTVRVGVANLMAATALTSFFVITHHAKTRGMFQHQGGDFVFDVFYSAACGGSAVALFFLLTDGLSGDPFFTPALIGHVLFLGASAETVVDPQLAGAAAYIIPLHFAWSLGVAGVVTWMVHNIELRSRHPVEVLLVLFVVIEVCFLLVVPVLLPGVIARIGIIRMLFANLLAASAMSFFFVWSHTEVPGLSVAGLAGDSDDSTDPKATRSAPAHP
jgi:hypothetical protein